ncbi:MAG: hypothetical protein M1483_00700 [Actinobacteria bacterium]|jgi:hypothetical protein|nr:hypothetical protein [Actinomycetota bacterium]MCL6104153.1 hypothetical protein [Actinomycetota bacterium]
MENAISGQIGSNSVDQEREVLSNKAKPKRKFSESYKRQAVEAYLSFTVPGEKGAFLRREGLISHTVPLGQERCHIDFLKSLKYSAQQLNRSSPPGFKYLSTARAFGR